MANFVAAVSVAVPPRSESAAQGRSSQLWANARDVLTGFSLPLVSGVALAACFPPLNLRPLAWLALVPLALALARPGKRPELYLSAYLGGAIFHLVGLDWMRTSYGGQWLSGERASSWFLTGTAAALAWPIAFWIGRQFYWRRGWPLSVTLALVWLLNELARDALFLVLVEDRFPWLALGLTQAGWLTLMQVADIAGVAGLGALVAMVNGLIADVWLALERTGRYRATITRHAAVAATVFVLAIGYGWWRLGQPINTTGPSICLVSADCQPGLREGTVLPPADLYLWSETAYAAPLLEVTSRHRCELRRDKATDALERLAAQMQGTLAVGCIRLGVDHDTKSRTRSNSMAWFLPDRGYQGCYDKIHLVPWHEFSPALRFPLAAADAVEFAPGSALPVFTVAGNRRATDWLAAATICFDTCFPDVHRALMKNAQRSRPPDFFVVGSSEASDATMSLQQAILTHARFRAIECRRSIVRNVDNGYSGIIDGSGRVIVLAKEQTVSRPTRLGRIPIDTRRSIYVHCGNWLPAAASIVLLAGAFVRRRSSP